jgi:F-type H+-transporting ATPase subunit c
MAILAVPGMAWAADAAGGSDMAKAFAVLAAGLGFGLAAGLCGLGQGRAAGSAVDAMARQPGAIARIQTAMLLGLAFIESLVLFVFVIAVILLFVKSSGEARRHRPGAQAPGRHAGPPAKGMPHPARAAPPRRTWHDGHRSRSPGSRR